MTKRFGVDLKITRLMLHMGLMCARLEQFPEAEQIGRAIKAYRNDLPHPYTGLALTFLSQNNFQEAEQELKAALSAYPDHQIAKALLGLIYLKTGRAGWRQMLLEVIEDGREEYAIKLAQQTLSFDAAADSVSSEFGDTFHSDVAARVQRVYA